MNADDDAYMDPRVCLSPNVPVTNEESAASMTPATIALNPAPAISVNVCGSGSSALGSGGPVGGPSVSGVPAGAGYMDLSPVILERLGPRILRAHPSTAQHKQIPHSKWC